jgi:thioredoxin reductase
MAAVSSPTNRIYTPWSVNVFDSNVIVIGAGPNGLSVAAHLSQLGIERRVFGRTMDSWRSNMPAGMFLKSEPYGSDICSPGSGYLLGDYCRTAGEEYHHRVVPVSVEQFIRYGSWFADQLVPDVEDLEVTSLSRKADGFEVCTGDGQAITSARVVVSTGIIPFAHIPDELREVPAELVSHTSSESDLGRFAGRKVLVIGAGQSALETAALLHEQAAQVTLVMRQDWGPFWLDANPLSPTRLERLRRPVVRLCEGWFCWRYERFAGLFRYLPETSRLNRALNTLGPAGAWWLRDRVEGKVPIVLGHSILGAEESGDGVRLRLTGPEGQTSLDADHVIAGTGYRLDIEKLGFLDPSVQRNLRLVGRAPALGRGLESSIPGMFFTGALAAPSFGPGMRFVSGTHIAVPRLAQRIRFLDRRDPARTAPNEHGLMPSVVKRAISPDLASG